MKKVFILLFVLCSSCFRQESRVLRLKGETMGTTYHITLISSEQEESEMKKKLQTSIDSLLTALNNSVSTFIPSSIISEVNMADTLIEVDEHFAVVFKKAQEVSEKTNGAFDVTVLPLVNAWGFGFTDTSTMDSAAVDSLRQLVDYRKVRLTEQDGKYFVLKNDKRIQLDFSAIAKGYGVDLVGMFLEKKGIENYMVEIGGEVRTKGKNEKGQWWKIGIEKPVEQRSEDATLNRDLTAVLNIKNQSRPNDRKVGQALATSGNYRNFYYRSGKKISHEIDPKTGYPAQNDLLSVTVIANDCMTADAFATAFMVMGTEETWDYLQQDSALNAFLIYAAPDGKMKTRFTEDISKIIGEER